MWVLVVLHVCRLFNMLCYRMRGKCDWDGFWFELVFLYSEDIEKSKFNSMIGLVDRDRVDQELYDDHETEKAREVCILMIWLLSFVIECMIGRIDWQRNQEPFKEIKVLYIRYLIWGVCVMGLQFVWIVRDSSLALHVTACIFENQDKEWLLCLCSYLYWVLSYSLIIFYHSWILLFISSYSETISKRSSSPGITSKECFPRKEN